LPVTELIRPALRPTPELETVNIEHRFLSGPERISNILTVDGSEYKAIIDRIVSDTHLIEKIVSIWKSYSELLAKEGKRAEPPTGNYHEDLMKACDPNDPNRAATLATVFGEKIEGDALYQYIITKEPTLLEYFSVNLEV